MHCGAFDSSTWEVKTGRCLYVQDQSGLCAKFQGSQGDERPCLSKQTKMEIEKSFGVGVGECSLPTNACQGFGLPLLLLPLAGPTGHPTQSLDFSKKSIQIYPGWPSISEASAE